VGFLGLLPSKDRLTGEKVVKLLTGEEWAHYEQQQAAGQCVLISGKSLAGLESAEFAIQHKPSDAVVKKFLETSGVIFH
jgi:hypothetical protein